MLFIRSAIFRIIFSLFLYFYAVLFFQSSKKKSPSISCAFAFLFVGIWKLLDALQCLNRTAESILLIQNFTYLLANISTYTMLCIAVRLSVPKNKSTKNYHTFLVIFPLAQFFISSLYLLFTSKSIFVTLATPLNFNLATPGYHMDKLPFYYIHSLYSYGMIATSLTIFVIKAYKTFSHLKKTYFSLLIGTLVYLIPSLIRFSLENFNKGQYSFAFDFVSEFSFFITCTIYFFVLYFIDSEHVFRIFSDSFFDSADEVIILFNSNGKYLNTNKNGIEFFNRYILNPSIYTSIDDIFDEVKFQKLDITTENEQKNIFYLSSQIDKQTYYCSKHNLINKRGKYCGFYIIINELEIYNSLINKLEQQAYIDELTGCHKRITFVQNTTKKYYSNRESFLIVSCRIPNLQECNQVMGFTKTDNYIVSFYQIINNALNVIPEEIAKNTAIFRMTGSIFSFTLPADCEKFIPDIFKLIKSDCTSFSRTKNEPLKCSLGYSIVPNGTNINKGFEKSYQNMLLDTKDRN